MINAPALPTARSGTIAQRFSPRAYHCPRGCAADGQDADIYMVYRDARRRNAQCAGCGKIYAIPDLVTGR